MKAPCTLSRMQNGTWLVQHSSSLGTVEVSAGTRDEALTKMQNELQYRIELCPCSGVSGDTVELRVSDEDGSNKNTVTSENSFWKENSDGYFRQQDQVHPARHHELPQTTKRAAAFRAAAKKMGCKEQFWTLGRFDGLLVFEATDEES